MNTTATNERMFKHRNDFYYITLLVYVIFAVMYILITGTISNDTVEFGFRDPVVYIIGVFIIHASVMLVINVIRNQQLILQEQRIVIRTRFRERFLYHTHIEKIALKHQRRKINNGTFALIKLKLANRRRWVRIRAANYQRETELYEAFKELKQSLHK